MIARIAATLLVTAALAVSANARWAPVVHLSGISVEVSSPAGPGFRPVEVVVTDWSSVETHRLLARTLVEEGSQAFVELLCAASPVGTIRVPGYRAISVRYARQVTDRKGGQRVYLASDSPMSLTPWWFEQRGDTASLTFLEIRLDRSGFGVGKLGAVGELSVDENGNVVALRDFESQPPRLVLVLRIEPVD